MFGITTQRLERAGVYPVRAVSPPFRACGHFSFPISRSSSPSWDGVHRGLLRDAFHSAVYASRKTNDPGDRADRYLAASSHRKCAPRSTLGRRWYINRESERLKMNLLSSVRSCGTRDWKGTGRGLDSPFFFSFHSLKVARVWAGTVGRESLLRIAPRADVLSLRGWRG